MNKTDLVNYVSDKTLITKRDASIILDVVIDGLKESIYKGERIKIKDFGSFFIQNRKARTALNPKNQEVINVPAKKVIKFSASKSFLSCINK